MQEDKETAFYIYVDKMTKRAMQQIIAKLEEDLRVDAFKKELSEVLKDET